MKEAEEADVREYTANKTTTRLLLTLIMGPENFDAARSIFCGAPPKAKRLYVNAVKCQC